MHKINFGIHEMSLDYHFIFDLLPIRLNVLLQGSTGKEYYFILPPFWQALDLTVQIYYCYEKLFDKPACFSL